MLTKESEPAQNPPRNHHEHTPNDQKVKTLLGGSVIGAHRGSIQSKTGGLEVIHSDSESAKSYARIDTKPLVTDQSRM
jgi:hypothetical protein